jgi:hypothetical protein
MFAVMVLRADAMRAENYRKKSAINTLATAGTRTRRIESDELQLAATGVRCKAQGMASCPVNREIKHV